MPKSATHLQLEASVALLDGDTPKAAELMRRSRHVFRLCDAEARFLRAEVIRFAWKEARKHAKQTGEPARKWIWLGLRSAWNIARQQVGDTRMLIAQAAFQDGRIS